MRKTLHALPLPLAAAAHAATLGFRERDARRAVLNAGYTAAAIEPDNRLAVRAASGRPAAAPHHRGTPGCPRRRASAAGRLAIKVAWERGTIAYINATAAWNREARTFALTSAAYPALDTIPRPASRPSPSWSPPTSTDTGQPPFATPPGGRACQRATSQPRCWRCGRPVVAVATPWSGDPCLMFADQPAESTGNEPATTGVQFLAHEDTALKAYFQTRDRYLGGPAAAPGVQPDRGSTALHPHRRRSRGHLVMERPHRQRRNRPHRRQGPLAPPGAWSRPGLRRSPRRSAQGWEHRPASRWSVGSRPPVSPAVPPERHCRTPAALLASHPPPPR